MLDAPNIDFFLFISAVVKPKFHRTNFRTTRMDTLYLASSEKISNVRFYENFTDIFI